MARARVVSWSEAQAFLAGDSRLGKIVERVGPCRLIPRKPPSLFAALLKAVIYQQLSGRAAGTIHQRVLATLCQGNVPTAEAFLKTNDPTLRTAGLSRGKLAALRALAAHEVEGQLPTLAQARRITDEELVTRLTAIRGIGPWTVHMLLIFDLGRPDVWPIGDLGVRSAVRLLWRKRTMPDDRFMLRLGESFRPWRSIASWYLWRSHELPPD